MTDLISRAAAIDALGEKPLAWMESEYAQGLQNQWVWDVNVIKVLPSVQPDNSYSDGFADGYKQGLKDARPERVTDDDFETIRIHLNAQKEKLCNLHRWEEAEEYQRIINRFMSFASAQPERKKGKWIYNSPVTMKCNQCGLVIKDWDWHRFKYCPHCGADMREASND